MLAKYAGFDSRERDTSYEDRRRKIALAISASAASAAKIRRWREAARVSRATPAIGSFPYPHPTCAQVLPRKAPRK